MTAPGALDCPAGPSLRPSGLCELPSGSFPASVRPHFLLTPSRRGPISVGVGGVSLAPRRERARGPRSGHRGAPVHCCRAREAQRRGLAQGAESEARPEALQPPWEAPRTFQSVRAGGSGRAGTRGVRRGRSLPPPAPTFSAAPCFLGRNWGAEGAGRGSARSPWRWRCGRKRRAQPLAAAFGAPRVSPPRTASPAPREPGDAAAQCEAASGLPSPCGAFQRLPAASLSAAVPRGATL